MDSATSHDCGTKHPDLRGWQLVCTCQGLQAVHCIYSRASAGLLQASVPACLIIQPGLDTASTRCPASPLKERVLCCLVLPQPAQPTCCWLLRGWAAGTLLLHRPAKPLDPLPAPATTTAAASAATAAAAAAGAAGTAAAVEAPAAAGARALRVPAAARSHCRCCLQGWLSTAACTGAFGCS